MRFYEFPTKIMSIASILTLGINEKLIHMKPYFEA